MPVEQTRLQLEIEFLRMCRVHGPDWIESVIRPLRLQSDFISVRDIPASALGTIVRLFGKSSHPPSGVTAS